MRAERFSNEAVNEMMQLIKTVKKRNKDPQILYTVNSGYSSWAKISVMERYNKGLADKTY